MEKMPEEIAKEVERSLEGSPYVSDDIARIAAAIREAEERGEKKALGKLALSSDKGSVYTLIEIGDGFSIFANNQGVIVATLLP